LEGKLPPLFARAARQLVSMDSLLASQLGLSGMSMLPLLSYLVEMTPFLAHKAII